MRSRVFQKPIGIIMSLVIFVSGVFPLWITATANGDSGALNEPMISAGRNHTLALKDDGTVWAWGANNSGQLGTGNTTASNIPVPVGTSVPLFENIIAVSAGQDYSLALKNDGTVWSWGANNFGQLGQSSTTPSITAPAQVRVSGGMLSNIIDIDAGTYHSAAVSSEGRVFTWGNNYYGQLGNHPTAAQNNILNSTFAIQARKTSDVNSFFDDIAEVSAGNGFTVARSKDNGFIWVWGRNDYGQLGRGNVSSSPTNYVPSRVSLDMRTTLDGITSVKAGSEYVTALRKDGTVWSWGNNFYGQLGDGTYINRSIPVQAQGLESIAKIDAGKTHTASLRNDGTVWSWGGNHYGQLGDGTLTERTLACESVIMGDSGEDQRRDISVISAGQSHTLAARRGSTYSWGRNRNGQLGDGTSGTESDPDSANRLSAVPIKNNDGSNFDMMGLSNNILVMFDPGNGIHDWLPGGIPNRIYETGDRYNFHGDFPEVSLDGHTFAGWYTMETGGVKVNPGDVVANMNHSLYARLVPIPLSGIRLESSAITIGRTKSREALGVEYFPGDVYNKGSVTWSSNNTAILSVNTVSGVITGLQNGTAVVTARSTENPSIIAHCAVTVVDPIEGISLDQTELVMESYQTSKLTAIYEPEEPMGGKGIRWVSSNQRAVHVDDFGNITSGSTGTAVITAYLRSDESISAECRITVVSTLESIELSHSSLYMSGVNQTKTIEVYHNPSGTTDSRGITWTSSNPSVATVSTSGVVTAVARGNAVITASSAVTGITPATCEVRVYNTVTDNLVVPNNNKLSIAKGNVKTFPEAVSKSFETEPLFSHSEIESITWTVVNPAQREVLSAQRINSTEAALTAISGGTVIVTADITWRDGQQKKAVYEIRVTVPLMGITLNKTNPYINLSGTATLPMQITLHPLNATDISLTAWSSSNTDVATVDRSGMVTAHSIGKTTITARVASRTVSTVITVTSTGDANGDGIVNIFDMLTLREHIVGTRVLTDGALSAADTNRDGEADLADMLIIRNYILGYNGI
ncbi:MAG: Ig-like domain-containing protein [Oscillospiraceae bacterium]|nr:Ig-like domain-containing protein [Oscillospiraceae bacterium]